jgi:hypothetical protein
MDELIIKINKEFNMRDEYVIIDPKINTIIEGLGVVTNETDDLLIYHNLSTLDWLSKSKYEKMWNQMNLDFDIQR